MLSHVVNVIEAVILYVFCFFNFLHIVILAAVQFCKVKFVCIKLFFTIIFVALIPIRCVGSLVRLERGE